MIKLLSFLILLNSCSSKPGILKKVQDSNPLSIKKIPVESRQEAKKYIQNQRNFLVLLFEQSRDPYYGTPKWNEQCLKENKIGDVIETNDHIILTSTLYFDDKGAPGFCFEQRPNYGQQIMLYCEGKKEVLDMKYKVPALDLEKYTLCD